MNCAKNKMVVVGAGMVGAAVLNTALSLRLLSEIVLIDQNMDKARGEALDASHTTSFAYSPNVEVRAGGYEDCADAQVIVITAGPSVKPNDHRERTALAATNTRVVSEVMTSICRYTREAMIIMVTNPLDVTTYWAQQGFGYPARKIIGTGTMLDTARLRRIIAQQYHVDAKNVHAYMLGEHGNSAFADWSLVNIGGIPLDKLGRAFPDSRPLDRDAVLRRVIRAGYEITRLKGYTNSGIAMSVGRLIRALLLDEGSILPVSTTLEGEYGISDVAVSIPCVVGSEGISHRLELPLAPYELSELRASAAKLAGILDELHLRQKKPTDN